MVVFALLKVAPSALGHVVRPTAGFPAPFPLSPVLRGLCSLMGQYQSQDGVVKPLEQGQSICVEAKSTTAAGYASAVALAMRHGAQIVPCAVYGSSSEAGGPSGRLLEVAVATIMDSMGMGRRGGRGKGVTLVCAKPLRVPFTAEPTLALLMEFAQATREAATKVAESHAEAFYGVAA